MSPLPPPPAEVPENTDLDALAPRFRAAVIQLLETMGDLGHDPIISEGFRSDERQEFLYGFGRDYDDGRGVVTQASTGRHSWHRYGCAVDIISKSRQWDAPLKFWHDLAMTADTLGLVSGSAWRQKDLPHVQVGPPARVTPSDTAWELLTTLGVGAVWQEIGWA